MALRLKLKWRVGQGVRSRVRKGVWGLRSMYLLCPCPSSNFTPMSISRDGSKFKCF